MTQTAWPCIWPPFILLNAWHYITDPHGLFLKWVLITSTCLNLFGNRPILTIWPLWILWCNTGASGRWHTRFSQMCISIVPTLYTNYIATQPFTETYIHSGIVRLEMVHGWNLAVVTNYAQVIIICEIDELYWSKPPLLQMITSEQHQCFIRLWAACRMTWHWLISCNCQNEVQRNTRLFFQHDWWFFISRKHHVVVKIVYFIAKILNITRNYSARQRMET